MSKKKKTRDHDGEGDDPLDAAGRARSWLTGQPWSAARAAWAAAFSRFPIYARKDTLRELSTSLEQSRVTIVVSATGSGKTVCTPPLLLKQTVARLGLSTPWRIAVTVPKRSVAASAAERGALTLDVPLGSEIGYLHRGSPPHAFDRQRTRLVYSTDGTLLSQARRDPLLSEYAGIIIDEVHERPVPTDMLLLAVRSAMLRRPDLKLVLMSATIDPEVFKSYFAEFNGVHVVHVAGETLHRVRVVHVDSSADDYMEAGLRALSSSGVLSKQQDKDVIFFVPTSRDALQGCRAFRKLHGCPPPSSSKEEDDEDRGKQESCAGVVCSSLFSKLPPDEIQGVLRPLGPAAAAAGLRKVIFATNVAESSLTIKNLGYVIDSGLQLTSRSLPLVHGASLAKGYASRAQILQRIGRVGRTSPGTAFLLYSKQRFDALPAFPPPAILETDMSEYILMNLRVHEREEFQSLGKVLAEFESLITPPTSAQMLGAVSFLHFYRLIDIRRVDSVDFLSMPYAEMLRNLSGGGSRKERKRVSKARTFLQLLQEGGFEGCITRHGRLVLLLTERLKMSVWNVLLVAAGAMYDCVRETAKLACIFEAVNGEVATLWTSADSFPKGQVKDSDHESLLGVYQTARPLMKEPQKLSAMGLAPGTWWSVHEKIKREVPLTVRVIERFFDAGTKDALRRACPLYALAGAKRTKKLTRALLAARLYHAAVPASTTAATLMTTVCPPVRVVCPAAPDLASARPPRGCVGALYEQLFYAGGTKPRMTTVTWLSVLPAGLRP